MLMILSTPVIGQIVISGNENKIDLSHGKNEVVTGAKPDSISILNFSQFPPQVVTLDDVPNSVIGPPSNIAISPDGTLALVANSIRLDSASATGWVPEAYAHIVDLTMSPPTVRGRVKTELQPSGLSFTPDGRRALVANRASGTISVLRVENKTVEPESVVKICQPADNIADVAVSPDGRLALASLQKAGCLALLKIDERGAVADTGRRISVYGQPYRCVITPDGALGVTAGSGYGNGVDLDAVSVIDLKAMLQPQTIDYIPVGSTPESLEISPDGKLVAVVVMDGCNLPAGHPLHSKAGAVVILQRRGNTFVKQSRIPTGAIPEGVAFTGDGRYLLVQCHPDRQIRMYRATDGKVEDTGQRIDLPGMPSSLRAAPPVKK
jgi:DNA-binding beta-propeller fold protein YncE